MFETVSKSVEKALFLVLLKPCDEVLTCTYIPNFSTIRDKIVSGIKACLHHSPRIGTESQEGTEIRKRKRTCK